MNNIVLVEKVDGIENLLDSPRGILLGEFSLLADAIEQLAARSELCDDVVLVLRVQVSFMQEEGLSAVDRRQMAYPRFEPVDELDNVWVVKFLQQFKLVMNHALIALYVLLQNDFDSDLARRAICLTNDTIGSSTEGAAESVFGSADGKLEVRGWSKSKCKRTFGSRTSYRSYRAGREACSGCC